MRPLHVLLVPAFLAAFALAGCNGLNPSGKGTGTTLRVANLVPGTTAVTVTAGSTSYMTGSPFETITGNQDITAGAYTFNVFVGNETTPANSVPALLANVSSYTFIPYGPTAAVGGLVLPDTFAINIPAGNFGLRVGNVSLDRRYSRRLPDRAGGRPQRRIADRAGCGLRNLSSSFVVVPLGNYQLRFTRSGTKEVVYDAARADVRGRLGTDDDRLQPRQRQARQRRDSSPPTGEHSSSPIDWRSSRY